MKKVLFGLIVLAGFAACTSDDVVISESTGITSDTAEAYLTVNIKYADEGGTRATDGGFVDALASEYAVSDAYFYFFDEDGEFVSRAEVWEDGDVDATENDNINYTSSTVVVLKGLTQVGYPRYMVTVLNEPEDFENGFNGLYHEAAGTLDEFIQKLAYGEYGAYNDDYSFNENTGIVAPYGTNGTDYFVMSTTSYAGADDATSTTVDRGGTSPYYFTTKLQDDDFYEEPVSADNTNAVDVYVERLAAKVSATYTGATEINIIDLDTEETGTINAYPVTEKMSIAGEANDDDKAGNEEYTGEHEGDETIYIALDGWKLNATARQSYISKNIDTTWQYTWGGGDAGWNDVTNSRSYWGMAYLYDKEGDTEIDSSYEGVTHKGYPVSSAKYGQTYPTDAGGAIDANQAANYDVDEIDPETWLNGYVKYTSLAEGTMNAFTADNTTGAANWNDYEYCAENTNTVGSGGIVDNLNSSAITSALIKATAYTKVDGTDYYAAQTLIRFEGELFTESAFNEYITQRVITDVDKDTSYTYDYSVADIYVGASDASVMPMQFEGIDNAMSLADIQTIMSDYSMTQLFTNSNLSWTNEGSGNIAIDVDMSLSGDDYQSGTGEWMWVMIPAGTTYTTSSGEQTAATNLYYMAGDQDTTQSIITTIEDVVSGYNSTYSISAYLDGKMYYTVPIEHLNDTAGTTEDLVAGQYGVVRNHWYNLTISAVDKIGKGITDDNEVIVPTPEDPTYYYVQATINILSWKSVDQTVTLGQY